MADWEQVFAVQSLELRLVVLAETTDKTLDPVDDSVVDSVVDSSVSDVVKVELTEDSEVSSLESDVNDVVIVFA